MKPVIDYELIDHGIEHSQYFQGCGTTFTDFDECVTGIGSDPAEAIGDALEQLAQDDWETEELEKRILADEGWTEFPTYPSVEDYLREENPAEWVDENGEIKWDDCELHYHVSIRVKG